MRAVRNAWACVLMVREGLWRASALARIPAPSKRRPAMRTPGPDVRRRDQQGTRGQICIHWNGLDGKHVESVVKGNCQSSLLSGNGQWSMEECCVRGVAARLRFMLALRQVVAIHQDWMALPERRRSTDRLRPRGEQGRLPLSLHEGHLWGFQSRTRNAMKGCAKMQPACVLSVS